MSVTFDPIGLRIVEDSVGGDNALDWVSVYSQWKVWAALSDNIKYPPAFRVVGGDPISDIQNLGSTFFLLFPWKFRPAELSHRLVMSGNLYTDPAGSSPFVPTLGSYTVLIESAVSNLVDASVARLDLAQLLDAIYMDVNLGDDANSGTNTAPVQTIARAFELADQNNLTSLRFRGAVTLDRNATGWTFIGSSELNSSIDVAGFNVDGSHFTECAIEGVVAGRIACDECRLDVITGLDGTFRRCGISASFATATNATLVMVNCHSEVPFTSTPVCSVGANNEVSIRNWSGGLELQNVTTGSNVSVDLSQGRLILGPSNTGGNVLVRGLSELDDNSAGTLVVSTGLLQSQLANKAALAAALAAAG
jgi:hypothetical protein